MIPDSIVEEAKNVDMVEFLTRYYGFTFKESGGFRAKEHPSLAIARDRRGWTWHSQNLNGYGAISFLMKVEEMTFPLAAEEIIGYSVAEATVYQPIELKKVLQLPPKADNCDKIWHYLCNVRKLDPSIITRLIRNGSIYQDLKQNVVFVGTDT